MTAIVDRQTLISEFNAYIKRQFASDRTDTFLQLAHDRIFRDLRPRETMLQVQLNPTTTLIDLPDDFVDLRQLSYLKDNRRITLRSVGRHELGRFVHQQSQAANPMVYSIIGTQVEVAPAGANREYTLWYWQKLPQMVADDDTNIILTTYPYLYLYGMLIEGNVYIQDQEAREGSIQTYSSELAQVNGSADRSRFGEAPIIGAA